jgi:hypothetical protein
MAYAADLAYEGSSHFARTTLSQIECSIARISMDNAAVRINKKMSWHTFRHTFSTLLKGNGGGCQSCTGAVAALDSKDDVGHLHTDPESAEVSGAKQGSRHDPLETKL